MKQPNKLFLLLGLLFSAFPSMVSAGYNSLDYEKDSLNELTRDCPTDTCKFRILSGYFWSYANINLEKVRSVGEWAYQVSARSQNPRTLSDGCDIKGFIFEKEHQYDSAQIYFNKALDIALKSNYHTRTGWSYYHLGLIQGYKGNADSSLYYMHLLYRFYIEKSLMAAACNTLKQTAVIYYDNLSLPDSAFVYADRMLMLSRQIKDKDKEMEAYLLKMHLYEKSNNLKKLLETINEALIVAEKTNHQKALINIYYVIGDVFVNQKKNYEIAMIYYKKVLEICESKNQEWEATILNDIGALYLKQGNDSLALMYVTKGLKLARGLSFKHQISESYRNLGSIYKYQGKLTDAIKSFQTCYDIGCDKCAKIVFHKALVDIGDSYMELHNKSKALEYYRKSLDLAKEFKSNKELAISNFKIGNFYREKDQAIAKKFYLLAVKSAREASDIITIKNISDTLSSFFKSIGDYKEAFIYQSQARAMEDSINEIVQQTSLAEWELKFVFERLNKENEIIEQQSVAEIHRQKIYRNTALLVSFLIIILGIVLYTSYRRKKKDNHLLIIKNEEIEEKNREIFSQVEEITAQKDEIERISNELHEADEMKLRFFANISHEFRTPLTLILNPAKNLLKSEGPDSEEKKQLEHIYNNAMKLHDLTNQIMDLQKLDAGKLTLKIEEANIIDYCIGILSSFESLCNKKQNKIQVQSNCRSVIALFDKDKIGKILSNLLSNAFKFCYDDTLIEVLIDIGQGLFTFSVTDKGVGIPEEEINKTFRLYYQAPTKNMAEGTGIGLAYVKELVDFMNGKVKIESEVHKGTKVTISIPVQYNIIDNTSFSSIIPINKVASADENKSTDEFSEGKNTILIVEDNDDLSMFIADLLKADYNLLTASDGRYGLDMAIKQIPDLILSDVMMPNMSGFEMCTLLKKDVHTSHIPVILLTAKDSAQSSVEGYQTGADDYILKPFDNEILKLKIKNMLATRASIRKQYDTESNTLPNSGAYSDIDKNFMKKCIQIIEENINNADFSVDKLSSELAFSRSNLYRKIQSLTNYNPAELIRSIRMQHASKLLKTTDLRVYEVAMEVGYDNTNKFSQAFRRKYGLLPSKIDRSL